VGYGKRFYICTPLRKSETRVARGVDFQGKCDKVHFHIYFTNRKREVLVFSIEKLTNGSTPFISTRALRE